jgi:hypothetical protein
MLLLAPGVHEDSIRMMLDKVPAKPVQQVDGLEMKAQNQLTIVYQSVVLVPTVPLDLCHVLSVLRTVIHWSLLKMDSKLVLTAPEACLLSSQEQMTRHSAEKSVHQDITVTLV